MRNLVARERLDDAPPPAPAASASPRRSLWRLLLAPEPLAFDPERPAPSTRRGTLLRALLAPEVLPEEPPAPPRPARSRWLRWLVVPESLDPRP